MLKYILTFVTLNVLRKKKYVGVKNQKGETRPEKPMAKDGKADMQWQNYSRNN